MERWSPSLTRRRAAGKVPVFGILEREGRVFVEVLPTTRAKDVLALTVNKVRRGDIVYTDRYKSCDALMFCGYRHLRVDHGKYFPRGRVYINGLEGFWSYAKERIMKYHGVSRRGSLITSRSWSSDTIIERRTSFR
jgi:transposase